MRQDITFQSAGLTCRGWLDLPGGDVDGAHQASLAHGFVGTLLCRYGRLEGQTLVLKTSLALETTDPPGWLHHRLGFAAAETNWRRDIETNAPRSLNH